MNTFTRVKSQGKRIELLRHGWASPATRMKRKRDRRNFQLGIARLERWINEKGFELRFCKNIISYVSFNDMEVVINKCYAPGSQLAQLAHECGPILIDLQGKIEERFRRGYPLQYDKKFQNNLTHKTSIVEEEIEAWKRGEKLLGTLNIPYNKDTFAECKSRSLKSYFRWVVRKPKKFSSGLTT
jgi:hypothetical protein